MSLNVKIKKLHKDAVIPVQADSGSAGMDMTAISEKIVVEGPISYIEYGTGLSCEIPEGYTGLLFARSSISSNTTLTLANAVGVIDSSYRGEIKARFKTLSFPGKKYNVGDKIMQMIIFLYPKITFDEVDELSDTSRGTGGFGSSGV